MTRWNSLGNRGMDFEQMIEMTNKRYSHVGMGLIEKMPIPIKVLDVYQKGRRKGQIKKAFYEEKAKCDYMGTVKCDDYNVSVKFEAKSTNITTRFDLNNIKQHQYYNLKNWVKNGGIGFILVYFRELEKVYYLPFELLSKYYEDYLKYPKKSRKSIPIKEFKSELICKPYKLRLIDYIETMKRVEGLK